MSEPSIVHIWDEYMPGQFIEPHRYLFDSTRWGSSVIAGRGVNTETGDLPRVSYFERRPLKSKMNPRLIDRVTDKLSRSLFNRRFDNYCKNELEAKPPQLVHAHFGFTAARMAPMLSKVGIPTIVTFYGVDASAALKNQKWLRRYQHMFNKLDRFVVLSDMVKSRMIEQGCPSEKIEVWNIPAGVEHYPYRERTPAPDGKTRFITAARFVEKKGYPFLIRAFRSFLDSGRKGFLSIVGYGFEKNKIEDLIREHGLEHDAEIIDTEAKRGFPDLYNGVLDRSDIFVLPSTTAANGDDEGGPALTMICAQSSGLPVVCTPFVGSEVSLKDGETGVYCSQDDAESLAQKMIELSDNPELAKRLGAEGSRLVNREFSLTGQMERLEQIYSGVLQIDDKPVLPKTS